MIRFILRRTGYSVLILIGVLLLTFLLFDVASGDPAAAVLGKNPRPAEIESMRRELGADLPLLWGRRCRTELYPSLQFPEGKSGEWVLQPQFQADFPAKVQLRGENLKCENLSADGTVKDLSHPVRISGTLYSAECYRIQQNPWNSRFMRALKEAVTLDFGRTLMTGEPIHVILRRGVIPSLALMLPVFLGEIVCGVALALLAVAFKDRLLDRLLVLISVAGMSISYLVLIIAGQWFFGYYCNWFPVWGWGSPACLCLPVLIGIISGLGGGMRFYRTVFADELKKEYLRTAAAKGLSPWKIYTVHLLKNAAIPILTRASAVLPFLFTGSLLLETFFGIPGLGFTGIEAMNNADLQLLKALVFVSALLFVVINLLTDLLYAVFDPRIRLDG